MKSKARRFLAGGMVALTVCLLSCSKSPEPFKSTGFNSAEEIIENPAVRKAWSASEVTFYSDVVPTTIEGTYSAAQCHYYAKSNNSNIDKQIGEQVRDTLKFYDQSEGIIQVAEKTNSGFGPFTAGARSFIRGQQGIFTIFTENHNTDGSISVSMMSGQFSTLGSIQIKKVTVVTANPPEGIQIGDWYASEGLLVKYP